MKRFYYQTVITILILCIGSAVHAGPFTEWEYSTADSVHGISIQKIDSLFADYDRIDTPGCAVSVFHEGERIFSGFYGSANLDYNIPLGMESSFYMASVSKQFTAAAAALLIIRNELDYHVPVSEYIEEWPEWASEVQVKHLFNHTSGLPDIYALMDIGGISISNVMELEGYMEVIFRAESLKFEPGSEYSYTNSGYSSLAYLVQNISKQPFSEFVKENILDPLDMNNTHFHDNRHKIIKNRVYSYRPGNNGFRHTYLSNFQGVGGGGLYSTHNDWQHWEAFWNGRSDVSDELQELRTIMVITEDVSGSPLDYAKGLQIRTWKGQENIGHSGSFMGFKNDYRRYPETGYSFITLCNRGDAEPGEKNQKLANLFMEDVFTEFLSEFAGTYYNDELDTEYTISVKNGELILERRLSPSGVMQQSNGDKWGISSWEFEFYRDDNEAIAGFSLSTSRAKNVDFVKTGDSTL